MSSQNSPDLKHRDWLLRTTIKQVLSIDPTVSHRIDSLPDEKKHLILSDISEETLPKLFFLTNNDTNNNYLYLEDFIVYLGNNLQPLQTHGLNTLAIELWNNSDSNAFINNQKVFKPFDNNLINPFDGTNINISSWLDIYSAAVPFIPNTFKQKKTFSMILNPDILQGEGLLIL